MFASHNNLDNLVVIVDQNGLQIDGTVAEVGGIEPLDDKFRSFGFNVLKVDGHSFEELDKAFANARQTKGMPTAILMQTVKGKGVSFMENQVGWHGKATNDEEYKIAMAELEAKLAELEG